MLGCMKGRDREELTFGLIALIGFPLLIGVFPQFFVYAALAGGMLLFGWLALMGAGLLFFHALPALARLITRPFRPQTPPHP